MKHQDEKKHHIVNMGLKAFYQKGYNATGVKEITDAANIPKGSFYNYFKNKEDFAVETMRLFTEREIVLINEILSDATIAPLERIEKLYRVKTDHFVEKGSYSLGCYLCNITLEMADVSPVIAEVVSQCFYEEDLPIIDCLKGAQIKGDLDPTINVYELSDLIRDSWIGALTIMKAKKSPDSLFVFLRNLRNFLLK